MPLYEYECLKHGIFADWQTIANAAQPACCPDCGAPSARTVCAPYLGTMDSARREAHRINERSANEPRVVRRARGGEMGHDAHRDLSAHRAARSGHAHDHGHGHVHNKNGTVTHRSPHPWVVRPH
jgi:putative FmdB family regulatory protein